FQRDNAPLVVEAGGARVLIAHGEQDDSWNKVDYAALSRIKGYRYAPGSTLVKNYLNPITKARSMRFLNFLKPDFQGACLAALAVDPSVLWLGDRALTARMLWQLFGRTLVMPVTFAPEFAPEEEEGDLGLGARLAGAGFLPEEEAALCAPDKMQSFNPE